MNDTQKFHIGDVLSVTTGRLLSPEHIGGIYKILNFLTEDNLFTHQLPRATRDCRPWLLRRHPWLDDPKINTLAVGELASMLETVENDDVRALITGWLSKLTSGGFDIDVPEYLDLTPIPRDDHAVVDPVEELELMVDPEKIIVVDVDPEGGGS